MLTELKGSTNYCASVVELDRFVDLPNCDRIKGAIINGCQVIVGKEQKQGDRGLFFPVESALSKNFRWLHNLNREKEENGDKDAKGGFFENHGRVRAVKFRGHVSEGFFIPMREAPAFACLDLGTQFDYADGLEVCKKYIPKRNKIANTSSANGKKAKRIEDGIVDNQFKFHVDTYKLGQNLQKIGYFDNITITDKWHGTSAVYANVLVKRELKWYEKLAKRLGVKVQESQYGFVWSSRCVVKGVDGEAKQDSSHYYGEDIWGIVGKEIKGSIPKGYTVYGEIVGWTPSGGAIQKYYSYGYPVGQHGFYVYRVTQTNEDGKAIELSYWQISSFCAAHGLNIVPLFYEGKAIYLIPNGYRNEKPTWEENFFEYIHKFYVNKEDIYNPGFPKEGVVVRRESLTDCEVYKVKNYAFLEHETKLLDKGEVDTETEQTLEAVNG